MRLVDRYSHLHGEEHLLVNHPEVWEEIGRAIRRIDVASPRMPSPAGDMEYRSFLGLQRSFETWLQSHGWNPPKVIPPSGVCGEVVLPPIRQGCRNARPSDVPVGWVSGLEKNRIGLGLHFCEPVFSGVDVFASNLGLFVLDIIDVGIEVLLMEGAPGQSSQPPVHYEDTVRDFVRRGRTVPAVPLVLVGVAP